MSSIECKAKARTNNYKPCRQPAMANGRCRLHGGRSSGPKTKEGKQRIKLANTRHGFYSEKAIAESRVFKDIMKAYAF